MASTIKYHPLQICFRVTAFTVFAFFSPLIHFPLVPMWSKGAVLASNNISRLSRQTTQCDEDDYEYVKITEGVSDFPVVNSTPYNLHFDARELLREHGRSQIIIRAHTKICWEGGIIYGNGIISSSRNTRKAKRRNLAAIRIVGYSRDAEVRIHRIGLFDVHNAVDIQGEISVIAILDSRFHNVNNCIDGLVNGSLTIEDSLIEGCELRARGSLLQKKSVSDHVMMIRNNVIRINARSPESATALQTADKSLVSRSGLAIEAHGNVFLVENDNAIVRMRDWLQNDLDECSDNIVVWLGPGDGPKDLPECFSVTNDVGVWEEARSSWIRDHQIVEEHEGSLREPDQMGEPLELGDAESRGGSEGRADAQTSLHPESRGGAAVARLAASTLRSLAVGGFSGGGRIGSPWADGTLWSDGTGWKDRRRGSLVDCRESQGFRPLTGSTVCSP